MSGFKQLFFNRSLQIICLVLLFNQLPGQPLKLQQFNVANGLSDQRVHAVLQDRDGLLWIGTNSGGLLKYDGYSFTVFKNVPGNPGSLLDNQVNGLLEDGEGNIWVATRTGICKYIRADNKFTRYDFSEIFPQLQESFGGILVPAIDRNRNLWSATIGLGMARFNRDQDSWELQRYLVNGDTLGATDRLSIGCAFDRDGRLWAGVDDFGLIWFDPKSQIFRKAEFDSSAVIPDFSLPENMISCLYADATNMIWITTRNGVYKYNPATRKLKTIQSYQSKKLNFFNYYNQIAQDRDGNVWIANNFRGLLKFDGISDDFTKIEYSGPSFNSSGAGNPVITSLCFDRSGIMWMGTIVQGLLKFDPQRATFNSYQHNEEVPHGISGNQVFGLEESRFHKGKIYVGQRGTGLDLFDPINKTFKKVPLNFSRDIFGGSVRVIREEQDGTLLLGTWGDGLVIVNPTGKISTRFEFDSTRTNSLPNMLVRVLEPDQHGNYWVGTNGGLTYLDRHTNNLQALSDVRGKLYPQRLLDRIKEKIQTDTDKIGLYKMGNDVNETIHFSIIKPRNYLIVSTGEGGGPDKDMNDFGWISDQSGKEIWSAKSYEGSAWLGGNIKNRLKIDIQYLKPGNYSIHYKSDESHASGKWNASPPTFLDTWGIQLFELKNDRESALFQTLLDKANSQIFIEGRNIRSLHLSKGNILWVGTDQKGLNRVDLKSKQVKTYAADPAIENSITNNSVQYIHEDADGILWLATNGGLNRFDPKTETFTVFTEEDGLPTNYIASILPAENGGLWLATRNGLSHMVLSGRSNQTTFVNYDIDDGLSGTDFIAQVALKSSAGNYYFGGEHGLNEFRPSTENKSPPALYLADVKVSNISMLSPKSPLHSDTTLNDLKSLNLAHDQSDLTITYSALHFSNPAKNQYAHFMEGYDSDWIYDNQRTVTYTNLDPGSYTFLFKGSNRDGVWNEEGRSIQITIRPPWWQTIWAYLGYVFLFGLVIFAVDRIQRRRLLAKAKERMRLREAEMRAETAELQNKAAEAERRALVAENERKTKELEEARELQLSMLPRSLPQLPHLDIAVYMKTATEVGGDYYDFHVALDGTLTVVIGDATGHGMKAGTMVTTAKSLFNSYAPNPDILFSFQEITRCIKQMNLDKMSMCMTMLKIQGDNLLMSSAGMPPSFIFRRETRVVEEHLLQGMPLGTMDKFPYKIEDSPLQAGDTILLLSDGLPELQNQQNELYGYKRVRNLFEEVAEKGTEEIINALREDGSSWSSDLDPDDDITFVVLKVK